MKPNKTRQSFHKISMNPYFNSYEYAKNIYHKEIFIKNLQEYDKLIKS